MFYSTPYKFLLTLAVILPLVAGSQVHAQLSLTVNQDNGVVVISNTGDSAVSFNGYVVQSPQSPSADDGLLFESGWSVLPLAGGWAATDPNETNSEVVGQINANSSTTLAPRATQTLGNLYTTSSSTISAAQTFAGFGNEYRDLQFQYTDAGNNFEIVTGAVNYTGTTRENNLVLIVDITDGTAELLNESSEAIEIEAFSVSSGSGSLNTGGWIGNGINSQIQFSANIANNPNLDGDGSNDDPNLWIAGAEAGTSLSTFAKSSVDSATDLFGLTINGNDSYDLGTIFSVGSTTQDLNFDYLQTSDVAANGSDGVVRYVGAAGDFDLDNDIDGADFLAWQRGEVSSPPSSLDLDDWQGNYAGGGTLSGLSTVAVPEPGSCVLSLLSIFGLGLVRRR